MLYLTTGANGAGKTLLTLRDVREKSVKESRPVYYNGRFEVVPGGELDSWQKVDFKDWQSLPDGSIIIVDECHNDMPVRKGADPVPEHIKMLAEHRRRGFDFFLITQHPLNIDSFVRRLIGAPGWHRHLKRTTGAPLVSVLTWAAVNEVCQKAGSGESGSVVMVPYPKEVYKWYASTSLDTAKVVIPFQAKMLAACFVLFPIVAYFGWTTFQNRLGGGLKNVAATASTAAPPGAIGGPSRPAGAPVAHASAVDYIDSYKPRIEGLPYTAPRYDEVMKPVTAPYPAACVSMGSKCGCYSQQGTKLQTSKELCLSIVQNGFFMEWENTRTSMAATGQPLQGSIPETRQREPVTTTAEDGAVLASMRRK